MSDVNASPEEIEARLMGILDEKAALRDRYDAGDLSWEAYQATCSPLRDERDKLIGDLVEARKKAS